MYWFVVAIVLAVAGVAFGLAATSQSDDPSSSGTGSTSGVSGPCSWQLRIVTASSYEPVLQKAADGIAQGPDCVKVTIARADGSGAAGVVASSGADAWIADDASWPQLPGTAHIVKDRAQVVATSPLYVVTQRTAAALPASAQTWVGLGQLLGQPQQSQLVVSDPTASGAGMVAVGALAGAVLTKDGPLVSALDMMRAWQSGTTVNAAQLAVPKKATQIAVLPEYALLASGHASDYRVFAPREAAALMRFSLLPTDAAAADPIKNAAISRLGRASPDRRHVRRCPQLDCADRRGRLLRSDLASSSRFLFPRRGRRWVSRVLSVAGDLVSASRFWGEPDVSGSQVGRPLASPAAGTCAGGMSPECAVAEASASAS